MAGSLSASLGPAALVAGLLVAGGPSAAAASLAGDVLAQVNRARVERGAVELIASEALTRAAVGKARLLAAKAGGLASARPEHLTAVTSLEDLRDHLLAVGFEARRATAHVVVADRPLQVEDLVEGEPALRADLLDPELSEMGIGLARQGELEVVVAIVARSKGVDFARLTKGLEDTDKVRAELLRMTNEARRGSNRTPLQRDRCLENTAQRYADRMLTDGFYGHLSPAGQDVSFRVRGSGCPRRHVGENLARGQPTPREVIDGWLDSPGHRENLLHPDYRRVGFGLAMGREGDDYWILWVQVLAGQ